MPAIAWDGRRRSDGPSSRRATATTGPVRSISMPAAPASAIVTTVLLASSHVAVDGVLGGVTALGPLLQRLAVGERGLAVLVAAPWAAGSLTQPAFGVVADRIGAVRVAALGAAATGMFVGGLVLVRSSWTALVSAVAWVGVAGLAAAVGTAGALGNAALPLVILAAQRLAPYAIATASGLIGDAVEWRRSATSRSAPSRKRSASHPRSAWRTWRWCPPLC
ncbi:MAG TPA: hypothetical protein VFZ70_08480 [Euzebyales bacterium]